MSSPPFRQTKAKREALAVLADYFCLNAKIAAELLGISARAVQAHYQRLIDAQLVYGIRYAPEEHLKGAIPIAYGLSDSGVDKAFREGFATDSTKSIKGHKPSRIEHEIMISRFHLELARWCEENGWDVRWRQRNLQHGVYPDALFRVNGVHFFLEIERAKLGDYKDGEPQILRKLRTYRDYYDSADCEKDFGFRRFKILTVMRTSARAANLSKRAASAGLAAATFPVSSEQQLFDSIPPQNAHPAHPACLVRTPLCAILPRRSAKVTHFCSFKVTHAENTILNAISCGADYGPALSSTPQACGLDLRHPRRRRV